MKGIWWDPIEMVDFNNIESVNKLVEDYSNARENENQGIVLANKTLEFFKDWNYDEKNIEAIIQECEKK